MTVRSVQQSRSLKQLPVLLALLVLLSGCAHHYRPGTFVEPYGFFTGIWHGIVFPYSFSCNILSWVLSLFGIDFLSGIQIVGRPNTGLFYYIGFLLGLSLYGGSAAGASQRGA